MSSALEREGGGEAAEWGWGVYCQVESSLTASELQYACSTGRIWRRRRRYIILLTGKVRKNKQMAAFYRPGTTFHNKQSHTHNDYGLCS